MTSFYHFSVYLLLRIILPINLLPIFFLCGTFDIKNLFIALDSRVCGNPHGLIRKYGLMCCRQCFRSNAKEIGFIKVKIISSLTKITPDLLQGVNWLFCFSVKSPSFGFSPYLYYFLHIDKNRTEKTTYLILSDYDLVHHLFSFDSFGWIFMLVFLYFSLQYR